MGITATALGSNSYQIDYTTGTTVSDVLTTLQASITDSGNGTHGWSVFDAAAGTNAVCYTSLNKDGASSKYVVIDMNTAGVILLKTYESWNATTHTGTNKVQYSDDVNYGGDFNATGPGQIFLFVSPRWLAMCTRDVVSGKLNNNNVFQGIFGCFEFTRDNPEDTAAAGYPPFLWTNTSMFYYGTQACCGYSPRTRDGSTTTTAKLELATILGKTVGTTTKLGALIPSTTNVWNSKDWGLTLYVHEPSYVVRGRIYGLKAFTMQKMLFMDRATIPINSDFIYSATGTATDHHVVHCSSANSNTAQDGRVVIPI